MRFKGSVLSERKTPFSQNQNVLACCHDVIDDVAFISHSLFVHTKWQPKTVSDRAMDTMRLR